MISLIKILMVTCLLLFIYISAPFPPHPPYPDPIPPSLGPDYTTIKKTII